MNRRRFLGTASSAVVAGVGVSVFAPAVPARAAGRINLAFVPKALNNPVFEVTRAGAEDRVAELEDVAFRWVGPTTTDAAAQSQIIDDLVVQGINGICVSCNDPDALMPAINRAVREGVTVITWDADSPNSKRMTNVSIDQVTAGARAAELVVERAPAGKLAILTGTPGALNLEQRVEGFRSVIDKVDAIEVIATDPCNDDVQRAVEIVEQRINATPDLASYFFVGMWPFFADLKTMPRLKEFVAKGGVCVSLDALEGALNAVDQGYANALVGYSWYGFGTTSVDVLVNKIRDGKDAPDPMYTELFIVDENNIPEYMEKQRATGGRF
ncbi:substrate-binding domain-containing protein [Oricola sp.]|uniref:substrate-binding domain-containing protein n=1 Tax=Oricola sp. TaxID=1979950 RepID=UPI003BAD2B6F